MIYTEDGTMKVNGIVLPGVVKSIEVKESAKVDEQEVEGSASKPKQATGYEDAKITVELVIDDTSEQTKHDKLTAIRTAFRAPGQAVPQAISIVNEDTAAHGINKAIFKSLSHKYDCKKGTLDVTLEFWEYVTSTIQTTTVSASSTTSAKKSSGSKGKSSGKSTGKTSTNAGLSSDYSNYLKDRGKSPAIDDGNTTKATSKIKSAQS